MPATPNALWAGERSEVTAQKEHHKDVTDGVSPAAGDEEEEEEAERRWRNCQVKR